MAIYPTGLHTVALYLRKSRADLESEKRGEGETLSKHKRALYALAAKYDYVISDIYEEIVSGERIIDRPAMQRLLQTVELARYQAVLCMDVDRLGRGNMIDQGIIQDIFKQSRTLIITPRKVYDLQDDMDEEWSEFEAFMARRELKMITRRMQRGRRQSALEGKSISRKPPYGYLRDHTLHLHPNPTTAPIVKMIFALAAQGHGAKRISTHLTKLGIKSPSGKDYWDRSTIDSILKNPVYQGHIRWGHYRYQKTTNGKTGYTRSLAEEQTTVMKYHAHEPLVDHAHVAKYLAHVSHHPSVPSNKTLANPLAGLITCVRCGRAMLRKKTYNRPHHRLVCTTPSCLTKGTHFEYVERSITQTLQSVLAGIHLQPERLQKALAVSQPKPDWVEHQIAQLQASISQNEKQLAHLHDILEQGIYNIATFDARRNLLLQRLQDLDHEVQKARHEATHKAHTLPIPHVVHTTALSPWDLYQNASTNELKNELLKLFILRITYRREKEWTQPDHFELHISLRF